MVIVCDTMIFFYHFGVFSSSDRLTDEFSHMLPSRMLGELQQPSTSFCNSEKKDQSQLLVFHIDQKAKQTPLGLCVIGEIIKE